MDKQPHKSITEGIDVFTNTLNQRLSVYPSKLKLIIHAGTPKTGTTSLQVYLDKKQRKLRNKGILYPNRSHNIDAPKHQWLEKNLVQIHPQNLLDNFLAILDNVENINNSDAEKIHTILLSTEGFYNSWWDFSEYSKKLLKSLDQFFNIEIWVWFRDPTSFAYSFYKQCLRNPRIKDIPCYGKDISFSQILKDPWFTQRLDYQSFITECEFILSKGSVSCFKYQQDTVQTVINLLGMATPHDNPTPRQNTSMNVISAEIMRVINRYNLSAKEKNNILPLIQELNDAMDNHSRNEGSDDISDKTRLKIKKLSSFHKITLIGIDIT